MPPAAEGCSSCSVIAALLPTFKKKKGTRFPAKPAKPDHFAGSYKQRVICRVFFGDSGSLEIDVLWEHVGVIFHPGVA